MATGVGLVTIVVYILVLHRNHVESHVNEPCNKLLGRCLPPSPNIYCDSEGICRCDPKFPVVIGPHTCKAAKKIGDRCSHLKECTHNDPNSYCTKSAFESQCSCNDGYYYGVFEDKCVALSSSKKPSLAPKSGLLSSSIIFLLSCFALLCCLVFAWHSFCRVSDINAWDARTTGTIGQLPLNTRVNLPSEYRVNRRVRSNLPGDLTSSSTRPFSTSSTTTGILPSYDSAVYNQPPPSYEDAVKDSSLMPTTVMSESSSLLTSTTARNATITDTPVTVTTTTIVTTTTTDSSQEPKQDD